VAVNPSSHDVYANSSFDNNGTLSGFDQAGAALGAPFPVPLNGGVSPAFLQSAATSTGVFVPQSKTAGSVFEINSSTGALTQTINCSACPAPASFTNATSVAVDSAGNIYVADKGAGRLIKFGPLGDADPTAPVVFGSGDARAVAVNPANDHVFVGGDDGAGFHVTEYNSAGTEISDFGLGVIQNGFGGTLLGGAFLPAAGSQIAIDSNTGVVYVTDVTPAGDNSYAIVFTPVPAPTATTDPASGVTNDAGTLNATVNPNGVTTSDCHFEYVDGAEFQANGFTNATDVACDPDPAEAASDTAVSADVAGLAPQTTYHFRVVVTTDGGTAEGAGEEFTTLPNPPVATTEAATGISQTVVTLNAKVDAEGDDAECVFEYGTSTAYGKTAACSVNPVTGTAATAVSAALSALTAGTTYHFRVVAENESGTTNGSDVTFTTLADTCETNAALCPPPPPPVVTPPPPAGDDDSAYKACLAKATKAFKKAQKAAKKKKGKARAKAMKAANKAKAKAIKRCKALKS
jgi:hypothetical protein